eukprot:1749481-Prymnesium_polylepis.1
MSRLAAEPEPEPRRLHTPLSDAATPPARVSATAWTPNREASPERFGEMGAALADDRAAARHAATELAHVKAAFAAEAEALRAGVAPPPPPVAAARTPEGGATAD